jgi:predicted DNA-binding antitoxin AbrB/MazE fold protein
VASVEVIYESGVLRPVHPLDLAEGTRLRASLVEVAAPETDKAQNGKGNREPLVGEELAALLDQVANMPYVPHPDGRTDIAEHHDDILYPKEGKQP